MSALGDPADKPIGMKVSDEEVNQALRSAGKAVARMVSRMHFPDLSPESTASIDAQADGNFGGKDTSHRAGYGAVTFKGQTYTKMEWILRAAKLGHTLAAGESTKLVQYYEQQLDRATQRIAWLENELENLDKVSSYAIAVSVGDRLNRASQPQDIQALIKAAHDYMDKGLDDDGTEDA